MNNITELINNIKRQNQDLKEIEIEGVLYLLQKSQNTDEALTNNDLVRLTGLPKETIFKFKSTIHSLLDQTQGGDAIKLNAEGVKILNSSNLIDSAAFKVSNHLRPYAWSILDWVNTADESERTYKKDIKLEKQLVDIRKEYLIQPDSAKRDYDQFFATAQTSILKAQVLINKGVVSGKKIALLGDDDLISITLALLSPSYESITVFDIDKDLLAVIQRIKTDLNLKDIHTEHYDSRYSLNPRFHAKYDVVQTDPPYTSAGIKLFLNRAIQLLPKPKNLSQNYIFLFYGNSFKSPEKFLKVQEILSSFNLLIEDKIDKFARYYGAESIGSASSLYILKTTNFTNTLPETLLSNTIYTNDIVKEERFPFVDHYTIKILDVSANIVDSKKVLLRIAGEFCSIHKLKVVETVVTAFKGGGLTISFVLANSNLTIHTWPELNAVHMDLITCSPIYNRENLINTVSEQFLTKNIVLTKVE